MLDIRFVRAHPEIVKADLQKRNDPAKIEWIDDLLNKDARSRVLKGETDTLRQRRNTIARDINAAKKAGHDAKDLMAEAAALPQKIRACDAEQEEIKDTIHNYLMRLPNILHDSVPVGRDDSENVEVKRVGAPRTVDFEIKNHGQLAADNNWADFERATKIAGAGFYFLKGSLVLLDLALQRYALDQLEKKGFIPVIPPYMINRSSYEGVTDLGDFEKVMYKIDDDDAYLIATSEHPIGAMYQDEIFEEKDLPLRLAGISPCFRREIGAHGLDTKGLFRVHQFTKVEQFVFCNPEDSWTIHEELLANAEELFMGLCLPYRVVNICTSAAQSELIGPALLAVVSPIFVGVLLGPYAEPNQITYQVRIGRKVVYSGSARDAFEVFMRTSKLPPIPLAKVSRKRIEDHNNFTN